MTVTRRLAPEPASGNDHLKVARRVLDLEADGLRALGAALDETFVAMVELIASATGRVVVTGMGKSGHVARKIASTLASTGTPSIYVHPGEASHGDLGMITRADAVLMLSNSGNTPELVDIVTYARRYAIPLVAIVGRAESALVKGNDALAADLALVLPTLPEGCPMGLAPTTSTTMMMALGDALAVALLERRGFSSDDFRVLHPGGRLGKSLTRVSDIMHEGDALPIVTPETDMAETLLIMTSKSFGCVAVVDDAGRIAGIVTDGDLRRHMDGELFSRRAGEVMTVSPKTIRPQALAAEALGRMNSDKITALFAVEDGRPVGIVHIHDCLRAGIA